MLQPDTAQPDWSAIAGTLDEMLRSELLALEHLEPLAARLGLSAADAYLHRAAAGRRIVALTAAAKLCRQQTGSPR